MKIHKSLSLLSVVHRVNRSWKTPAEICSRGCTGEAKIYLEILIFACSPLLLLAHFRYIYSTESLIQIESSAPGLRVNYCSPPLSFRQDISAMSGEECAARARTNIFRFSPPRLDFPQGSRYLCPSYISGAETY